MWLKHIIILSKIQCLFLYKQMYKKSFGKQSSKASFTEARAGFEPAIRVLQTRALPLGYHAIFYYMLSSNER